MGQDPLQAWRVRLADFPREAGTPEQMRFLLRFAHLAPSPLNTQPWKFRVNFDGSVEVHVDETSRLAKRDPEGRLQLRSIGSAIKLFLLAAEAVGYDCDTTLHPNGVNSPHVATIVPRFDGAMTHLGKELAPQIPERRSTASEFARGELADEIRAEIRSELDGMAEISFEFVTDLIARQELADLVDSATSELLSDADIRNETADWLAEVRPGHRDGVPKASFELPGLQGWRTESTLRNASNGSLAKWFAARERDFVQRAPLLIVIGTETDDRALWPAVGGAYAVVELLATRRYLRCAPVEAPILLGPSRRAVQESLYDETIVPQMLVRIGYAPPPVIMPRRPFESALLK